MSQENQNNLPFGLSREENAYRRGVEHGYHRALDDIGSNITVDRVLKLNNFCDNELYEWRRGRLGPDWGIPVIPVNQLQNLYNGPFKVCVSVKMDPHQPVVITNVNIRDS